MTLEEAIKILIRLKDRINFEVTDSQKKMDALNMAIKALESPWISVSERLPEIDIRDRHGLVWKNEVLITGYLSYDKEEPFVTTAFASDVIEKRVPDTIVTAWMPLPEPYKVESEDTNES